MSEHRSIGLVSNQAKMQKKSLKIHKPNVHNAFMNYRVDGNSYKYPGEIENEIN